MILSAARKCKHKLEANAGEVNKNKINGAQVGIRIVDHVMRKKRGRKRMKEGRE